MFTLLKSLHSRQVYLSEPVSFVAALVIAELFYKFHSFTVECIAFLGTAAVLHVVGRLAIGVISDLRRPSGGGPRGASS